MKDDEIPTNLTPSERRYILSLPLNERRKALENVLIIRSNLRGAKPDDSDRRHP